MSATWCFACKILNQLAFYFKMQHPMWHCKRLILVLEPRMLSNQIQWLIPAQTQWMEMKWLPATLLARINSIPLSLDSHSPKLFQWTYMQMMNVWSIGVVLYMLVPKCSSETIAKGFYSIAIQGLWNEQSPNLSHTNDIDNLPESSSYQLRIIMAIHQTLHTTIFQSMTILPLYQDESFLYSWWSPMLALSIEVHFSCRSLDFCLGLIFAWY